jgi:hypothetical protein
MKTLRRMTPVILLVALAASPSSGAVSRVYFTDADSAPTVRPKIIDATAGVRLGPFRQWKRWGASTATATSRYRKFRTKVVLSSIEVCDGQRQYRVLTVSTFRGKKRTQPDQQFTNGACGK